MKARWTPMRSASRPCRYGISAPPTIAITSRLEALLVRRPSPSMPSVKMVGNMMELNSPMAMMLHMATRPVLVMVVASSTTTASANRHSSRRAHRTGAGAASRRSGRPWRRPSRARRSAWLDDGNVADVRVRDVVDEEAADRHLAADVDEDRERTETHVAVLQHFADRCGAAGRPARWLRCAAASGTAARTPPAATAPPRCHR